MPTSLLFDLDGVLVNTKPIQFSSLKLALKKYSNINVEECEELTKDIRTTEKLRLLAQRGLIKFEDIEEIYELKKEFANDEFVKLEYDHRLYELFDYIAENYNFGIVTNGNRESSIIILENLGIYDLVSEYGFLIANNDVFNAKPHPEPYIRAMIRIGGDLDDFYIFEDSAVGLASAVQTGARVIKVNSSDELTVESLQGHIIG